MRYCEIANGWEAHSSRFCAICDAYVAKIFSLDNYERYQLYERYGQPSLNPPLSTIETILFYLSLRKLHRYEQYTA